MSRLETFECNHTSAFEHNAGCYAALSTEKLGTIDFEYANAVLDNFCGNCDTCIITADQSKDNNLQKVLRTLVTE